MQYRVKFSCLDIILLCAVIYAISDGVRNWSTYKSCELPLNVYIISSAVTMLLFRLMHFLGQILSGDNESYENILQQQQLQTQQHNFAWEKLNTLRAMSLIQMAFLAPVFVGVTIYGSVIFVRVNSGVVECQSPQQEGDTYAYPFLIFWFIFSYVLITSYICLLCYGYSQVKKSASVKRSTLQLLRRVNHDQEMASEIYENSMTNIQEPILQHQQTVKTLREFGIFNILQQCISPQHFIKMRVVTYRDDFVDYGVVRCFICFGQYKDGDRLKMLPFCKHLCHIKCLELWMSFEAKCPECNNTYPGLEAMLEHQRRTSDNPFEQCSLGEVAAIHSMSQASESGFEHARNVQVAYYQPLAPDGLPSGLSHQAAAPQQQRMVQVQEAQAIPLGGVGQLDQAQVAQRLGEGRRGGGPGQSAMESQLSEPFLAQGSNQQPAFSINRH